jgi:signal transduction histidine kinase
MTRRLLVVVLLLCVGEALLIGGLVHQGARRSFQRFLQNVAVERFRQDVVSYYEAHGSLDQIQHSFEQQPVLYDREGPPHAPPDQPPVGPPPDRGAAAPPRFGLADANGVVMLTDGKHPVGSRLDLAHLTQEPAVENEGRRIGTILFPAETFPPGSPERELLAQVDRAIVLAAVLALMAAIGIGGWIARAYTRPLRELTATAHALAAGRLGEQAHVRGHAEVSTLARAFNRMSADLSRALGQRRQMTADIAHELRTPLTVLTGYLEAMKDGELAPTAERIATMHTEAVRLGRLVEDLRTLSLADAGELHLTRREVAIVDLLEGVRAAFAREADAKCIDLTIDGVPHRRALRLDADRMTQVLANLVSNALRHTPCGGAVRLASREDARAVRISVSDTGAGIPRDALPHVFERFYRGDPARQSDAGESGLGLAIARAFVEAHGGTIAVHSTPGEGSVFTIQLPM